MGNGKPDGADQAEAISVLVEELENIILSLAREVDDLRSRLAEAEERLAARTRAGS